MYPVAFERGKGCELYDYDGNQYTDFTCATGSVILGYANDEVDRAAAAGSARGGHLPMQVSDTQVELAELLCRLQKYDKAMFFKTGSDACTAAVRICRTHTKKRRVLSSGYHGFHDWQLNIYPQFLHQDPYTTNFGYNLNLLERGLSGGDVACVIVTPEPNFFPCDYWRELSSLADKFDTPLVFDEVMTSVRYGLGGYHAQPGIRPHLVTLGKGIANGYALAAVIGRKDLMLSRERTHLWSTYAGDVAACSAALETLKICRSADVPSHLRNVGDRMCKGLRKVFHKHAVRAQVTPGGAIFHVILEDEKLWHKIVDFALGEGVVFSKFDAQVMMHAHGTAEIDRSVDVVDKALRNLSFNKSSTQNLRKVSPGVLCRRTFFEFGGRVDFRAAPEHAVRHSVKLSLS